MLSVSLKIHYMTRAVRTLPCLWSFVALRFAACPQSAPAVVALVELVVEVEV